MFRMLVLVFLFSFLLSITWSVPQTVHGLYFGGTTNFSGDRQASTLSPEVAITPQIVATRAGNVYVVWAVVNEMKDHNITVQFTASADNGTTFTHPRVLSNDRSSASLPQIAATENGSVYVVWVDKNSTSGDSDIVFSASTNGGEKFGRTKTLSRDIEGSTASSASSASLLLSSSPQIAATENGSVYVVWVDKNSTSGDSDIVFRGSTNSGEKFGRKGLSRDIQGSPPLLSSSPQIAATENGSVYVVWVDKNSTSGDSDIVFRGSTNSGEKFGRKGLSRDIQGSPPLLSSSPQIASPSNGSVYVVWVDKNSTSGDSDIVFSASTNGNEKFDRKKLTKETEISVVSPQLAAIRKGNVYVLWVESTPQFNEILDYGTIVGEVLPLGQTTSAASYPRITATESGDIYMIWIGRKNSTAEDKVVYFKKSSQFFFDRNM
jgi:hypothetical protein